MNLAELIARKPPKLWENLEKIPWNDPDFSRRMLESHLSQGHDWASRRHEIIDRHVRLIADLLPQRLSERTRILDLGCGPGFYTQRLAQLGFDCTGVDFSPASIDYAQKQAAEAGWKIEYMLEDIRNFAPKKLFDAVLLTFGEFNVFKKSDAAAILRKAAACLNGGGFLLLEGHSFEAVKNIGLGPATWQTNESGVFSGSPHLCLQENFWDEQSATTTIRYFIVDAAAASVREYGSSMKGYWDEEYRQMFHDAGFSRADTTTAADWPTGDDFTGKLQIYICRKGKSTNMCNHEKRRQLNNDD